MRNARDTIKEARSTHEGSTMARFWTMMLLLSMALASSAAPAPKAPSTEEIRKAIEDLGSARFAVREKASKMLWEAGAAAEPLLRDAALSKDEETANRAKAILEKFAWGLYPDTPPEVLKIIQDFRGGDAATRREALGNLLKLKPTRFAILRKLITKEPNEEARQEMFARLAYQARTAVPNLLLSKQYDAAAELLEICLATNRTESYADFATLQALRGQVPHTIERYEAILKQSKDEDAVRCATTLVYLYRTQKEWKKAKLHATQANDGQLYDALAWEANDWAALLDGKATKLPNPAEEPEPGLKAAYARLAGNKAKYDEAIGELRKELNAVEGDDSTAFLLAHALLLNGDGAEGVKVLGERYKRAAPQVFDLLCTQMKYQTAFDLAAKAEKELENEPTAKTELQLLRLHKARTLGMLGDKDGATQLFRKELAQLGKGGPREEASLVLRVIIFEMVRAGMRDLALETLAQHFPDTEQNFFGDLHATLEPLFDDRSPMVDIVWRTYRREHPKEEPTATMKRITDLLAGKVERKEVDRLAELLAKKNAGTLPPKADIDEPNLGFLNDPQNAAYAIAEAYKAIKAFDKAGEYYKKAADAPALPMGGPRLELGIDTLDEDDFNLLGLRVVPHRMNYADFLMMQKNYAEAANYYHKAWEASPNSALPLFLEGQARKLAGDAKRGEELCELARWMPLGSEEKRARFSEQLVKRGYREESQREMQFVIAHGFFRTYQIGNIHLRLARALARKKDFATAAAYYEKDVVSLFRTGASFLEDRALLTVPELARVYRIRALLAAGKPKDADTEIQAALNVLPGNVDLAIGVVPDLDRAGKKAEADALYGRVKSTYDAALKEYANSPELRNGLAWTMVNCNRDLEAARQHAEKAVALAPKMAGYLDTLAEVQFRLKNRAKALELMKQCVELEPKNPYFQKQLQRFEKGDFNSPLPDEETGED